METKMYTTLFNAITDALEDLDKGDLAAVRARLMGAQRETEAMFIGMNSDKRD